MQKMACMCTVQYCACEVSQSAVRVRTYCIICNAIDDRRKEQSVGVSW